MDNMPTNDELVADPEQTMKFIAEGLGHFARLVCAALVNSDPKRVERIGQLLHDAREAVVITSSLRAGVLHTAVHLHMKDAAAPLLVAERADNLPPIMRPCEH